MVCHHPQHCGSFLGYHHCSSAGRLQRHDTIYNHRECIWTGGHLSAHPLWASSAHHLPQLVLQRCPLPAALLCLRRAGLLHVRWLLRPVRRLPVWRQSLVAHDGPPEVLPSSQPSRREAPAVQPLRVLRVSEEDTWNGIRCCQDAEWAVSMHNVSSQSSRNVLWKNRGKEEEEEEGHRAC